MRPTVSLVVIAKNEEQNLDRWWDSVSGVFDEYIFCDTGSVDRTIDKVKALPGVKLVNFDWCDDFAAARNFAFSHATSEYVAWADLDDVLSDKIAFTKWRDQAMQLSEYWLAPYHYALDKDGKPACSFMRERCWKRDLGLTWQYFIHEGVNPNGPKGLATANAVSTWSVLHHRTMEDLAKDKGRNLNIFKKHMAKGVPLDARMQYYYGKELFESGDFVAAAYELSKALGNEKLELHDRMLCMQYTSYAYQRCNQHDKALTFARLGIELAPQRAEYWVIAGDCLVQTQRIQDALPYYSAAMKCTNQNQNTRQVGLIFTTADAYGPYPANMLARCLCQLGRFDEAEKEISFCLTKWENAESKAILEEIKKIKGNMFGFKNAKSCEDIVFTCPGGLYEWDSDGMKTTGYGGSEQACIYMARHLKKLSGRNVIVFNIRQNHKLCEDGVNYTPFTQAGAYFNENKPYLHIAWRHCFKITDAPTFIWSHDLFTPGGEHIQNYSKYLCLSEFHKQYVTSMFGLPEDKILVTRNGIDSSKFTVNTVEKNPYKIVFPNSPDRGLEKVIRILDYVRDTFHVELFVYYGFNNMEKMGLHAQAQVYKDMAKTRPWVHFVGNISHSELLKSYEDAALWIYPTDFLETSCITALECISKGVYPIVRRWGALPYTLQKASEDGMCQILDSECKTEIQHQLWSLQIVNAIKEKAWTKVKVDPKILDWNNVAKEWLELLPKQG